MASSSEKLVLLDLVRGLAAIAVVIAHARSLLVQDWSGGNILAQIWYGASVFAHQAVVVFIALSGFFVGGSVLRQGVRTWSWHAYLSTRGVRLGLVLIPALVLTWTLDSLGTSLAITQLHYTGQSGSSVLPYDVKDRLGATLFVANAFFLQEVLVPTFGSNGALWSLAYEFWYYLLFPLLLRGAVGRDSATARGLYLLAACSVMWLLGKPGLTLFGVWLLGAFAAYLVARVQPRTGRVALLLTLSLFAAGLLASSAKIDLLTSDLPLAACFIPFMIASATSSVTLPRVLCVFSVWSAKISYSLYATHLPLVTLLAAICAREGRLSFSREAVLLHFSICLIAVGCGYCFWWAVERYTPQFQKRVLLLRPSQT
jgi:peptidoglycan/LPS O-acetylase OafA/YrhL